MTNSISKSTASNDPIEIKGLNVEVFNAITKIDEAKALVKIFHMIVNTSSIVQHVIQMKIGMVINASVSVKSIISAKKTMV